MLSPDVICEVVPSNKGHAKLVVNCYVLTKILNRGTSYYWRCELRKTSNCPANASTTLVEGKHSLKKMTEHNHAPVATRKNIAMARASVKQKASDSRATPAQIMEEVSNNVPQSCQSSLPTKTALRSIINRKRKCDTPIQPTSLADIDIPINLRTIDGEDFLIKDMDLNGDKILVFSTVSNIAHLHNSRIWIMDGTFETVPRLFHQLYTKVMPLLYALMTSKSQKCYTALFHEIASFAVENGFELNPSIVLSDFERAPINAIKHQFPNAVTKGCFFHLGQIIWRKVQSMGLARKYGEDPDFSLGIRQISALAFLTPSEIPRAFYEVESILPRDAAPIATWFAKNYVSGVRHRAQPLYPPTFWSVTDQMAVGLPRTQNNAEAWHRRLKALLGKAHVGVYAMVDQLRQEQIRVRRTAEDIVRGRPSSPIRKVYREREQRILHVYNDRGNRTTMEFLRGLAHNIHL